MRYCVTLSYDGSAFCGWQLQDNAPSVQGCLEDALGTLLGESVRVTGTGRTDTLVNAVGYVAHFDTDRAFDAADLCYKLNAILPHSVVVHAVAPVSADFHARFAASQRKYTYFLHRLKDPFVENYSLFYPYDLDVDAMNRAAALLAGRHDFACFQKTGSVVKSTVCCVSEAFWAPYRPAHVEIMGNPASDDSDWQYLFFRISADRFLRNMVRAIVGTLLEVGRGRRSIDDFASLILPAPDDGISSSDGVGHEVQEADCFTLRGMLPSPHCPDASPDPGTSRPDFLQPQASRPSPSQQSWVPPSTSEGAYASENQTTGPRPNGSLRSRAGQSVPGHALFFSGVTYPDPL